MCFFQHVLKEILGMGDVVSCRKSSEQYDEDEARKKSKENAKKQFSFDDFLSQQIKNGRKDLVE
jgi:signal recognition particle GTPase